MSNYADENGNATGFYEGLPFAEKYKPQNTSQLILNDIMQKKVAKIIETKTVPNMILSGKSGNGKTAMIHAIIKEIYPQNQNDCSTQILEINASDERGIKVVNETIVNFCKTCTTFREGYAQRKIVILDEADNMMPKAQKLISLIMDAYCNVSFVIICNEISNIIVSINSRCLPMEMSNLPNSLVVNKLKSICENEHIQYDELALKYLYEFNNNNFRQTLNMLEFVYQAEREKITIERIGKICGIPPATTFEQIVVAMHQKNVKELCKIIMEIKNDGYYAIDVLIYFIQYLKFREEEIKMIEVLGMSAYVMSSNTANYLQLTSAFLQCVEKM
jgi:DNA polymerase III delta prime subunit